MTRVEWSSGKEIEAKLDVSTGACSYCKGPARVPEDVAAVMERKGEHVPLIVCEACSPAFMARLDDALRQANIDVEYENDEPSE